MQARGWSVLLGHNRWHSMKFTSSTVWFLWEHVTKGNILSSALTSSISSIGLFGSLALFKEIEKAIDPTDTTGLLALRSLIDQVNNRIRNQLSAVGSPSLPKSGESGGLVCSPVAL